MFELGAIAFLQPWYLLALGVLPLVWILLRITPPAPKRIVFPALRLLFGLAGTEATPRRTTWWLILLRMLILSLVILALAEPVYAPDSQGRSERDILIVLDDGWAAAPDWSSRQTAIENILERAESTGHKVALLHTTAELGGLRPPKTPIFQDPRLLLSRWKLGISPKAWNTERRDILAAVEDELLERGPLQIFWLSDGLATPETERFVTRLERLGDVTLFAPDTTSTPIWFDSIKPIEGGLEVSLKRTDGQTARNESILAVSGQGEVLATATGDFAAGEKQATVRFLLPSELYNQVQRLTLSSGATTASTYLLDQSNRRYPVGVLSAGGQPDNKTLLGEHYYLLKALDLFTEVRYGTLDNLLSRSLSTIIVTDNQSLSEDAEQRLQQWVRQGGLLLRFGGPRLAEKRDSLLPVTLRSGHRSLSGSLTWEQALPLAPFTADSPLNGLNIPEEVRVSGQLLAQPSPELDKQVWSRLQDGTPLITAAPSGDGQIVLIHTTANTRWSNLALSGLFVSILQRVVHISEGVTPQPDEAVELQAHDLMDAFGQLYPAPGGTLSIDFSQQPLLVGPKGPPGYYGENNNLRALNLAGNLPDFMPLKTGLLSVQPYGVKQEKSLLAPLLLAALLLFLFDQLLTLWLRGFLPTRVAHSVTAGLAVLLVLLSYPTNATAQSQTTAYPPQSSEDLLDEKAIAATLTPHLAYVETNDDEVDGISYAGLTGLALQLHRRTAIEGLKVVAINPGADILDPYPLLYWPITPTQRGLSAQAVENVNRYLRNGGMILFDLRQPSANLRDIAGSNRRATLQQLTTGLDIPPLAPMPAEHVLTKSFYLLDSFPGRYSNREFWVEQTDQFRNDGVSHVLVGNNDWARAWAVSGQGHALYPMIRGGERQRELAYRFGVNLVMYAMTGNYKEDQVHVPHILERLGQ